MSGRLSVFQTAIADMRRENAVISAEKGKLMINARIRSRTGAFKRVLDMLKEKANNRSISQCVVRHARNLAIGEYRSKKLPRKMKVGEMYLSELLLPVASHPGAGAVGAAGLTAEGG